MAPSSSPGEPTSMRSSCRPSFFARSCIAAKKKPFAGLALFISTPTRLSMRHRRRQQLDLFAEHLLAGRRGAGQVATRARQAGHETRTHRVAGVDHDDGQPRRAITCRANGGGARRHDQRHVRGLELGRYFALALRVRACKARLDDQVLAIDPTEIAQSGEQGLVDDRPQRVGSGGGSQQRRSCGTRSGRLRMQARRGEQRRRPAAP